MNRRRATRALDERSFIDVIRGKQSKKQLLYRDVYALLNETHPLFQTCSKQCAKIILVCELAANHWSFVVRTNLQFHETLHRKMIEFKDHLVVQIEKTGHACSCLRATELPVPRLYGLRAHVTLKYVCTLEKLIRAYETVPGDLVAVFAHLHAALNQDLARLIMEYVTPLPCHQ